MMGGTEAHEFMLLNPAGEDTLVLCDALRVRGEPADRNVRRPEPRRRASLARRRRWRRPAPRRSPISPRSSGIPAIRDGQGDLLHGRRRPPGHGHRPRRRRGQRDQARQRGQGRRPPAGARGGDPRRRHGARLRVADRRRTARSSSSTISRRAPRTSSPARTAPGFHLRNVNVGRDFTPDLVTDIANAREGDPCPDCGSPVILRTAIEVGNIFKLGTTLHGGARARRTSARTARSTRSSWARTGSASGATWPASSRPITTRRGSPGRPSVAPYAAHLVTVERQPRPAGSTEIAEALHAHSIAVGNEILYDDRDESPGVKFTDAELLGMPWILTVSPRSLAAGGIEVTDRATGEKSVRSVAEVEALLASPVDARRTGHGATTTERRADLRPTASSARGRARRLTRASRRGPDFREAVRRCSSLAAG